MKNIKEQIEILIVEDDMDDAHLSITALEENNIENTIVHLKNGAEALDYIFHSENYSACPEKDHLRVILLDLKMPVIDGLEVLRRIKSDERTREIPVIVFTGSDEFAYERECYTLGAKDYIIKPLEADKFKKIAYKSVSGVLTYVSQIMQV